jgi:hypothetical protein
MPAPEWNVEEFERALADLKHDARQENADLPDMSEVLTQGT